MFRALSQGWGVFPFAVTRLGGWMAPPRSVKDVDGLQSKHDTPETAVVAICHAARAKISTQCLRFVLFRRYFLKLLCKNT